METILKLIHPITLIIIFLLVMITLSFFVDTEPTEFWTFTYDYTPLHQIARQCHKIWMEYKIDMDNYSVSCFNFNYNK